MIKLGMGERAMKKLFSRKSVLVLWIFAYMLVVLTPIVFNMVVFLQSQNVLKDKVMEVNQNSMEMLKKDLDGLVSNMLNAYIDLSYSSGVKRIAAMNNTDEQGYQYEMYQTVQDLRKFNNYVTEYEGYYVYFKKLGIVVNSSEPVSDRIFFSDMKIQDMTFEEWKATVQGGGNDYILYHSEDGTKNMMYYNPLIWQDSKDQDVVFLAKFDQNILKSGMERMLYGQEGNIVILNQNNEVMMSSSDVPGETLDMLSKMGSGIGSVQQNDQVITVSPSSVVSWRYAYILPDRVLLTDVSNMRFMTIFAIILSLLVSAVIILFVIKKQYTPINKLINMFGKEDYVGRTNEFSFLEDKLTETLQSKAVAEKALDKQNRQVRINYLRRFMKGRVEDDMSVNNILESMNCETVGKKYAVMQFYVRDYTALFQEDETLRDEQRIDLVNFIIENIGTELIEEHYKCYMFECDDMMVALILADEKVTNAEIEETLINCANTFLDALRSNFNVDCCVSVSRIKNACFDIPDAYQEATDAIEYAVITNDSPVVRYDEISEGVNDSYHFTYEQKQEFIRSMKIADIKAGMSIVDDVLKENAGLGKNNIQGIVVDFVAVIMRGVNDIYKESGGMISQKDIYQIQKLLFCNDIMELRDNVESFLKVVCDRASSLYGEDNLVSQIKVYVEENYTNSNLNVASLGEHFSKTPHYISKLFKDDQGIALLEYINSERVEAAKRLLVSSKKTLADIAEEIGFTNVVTFIRVFKKFEGVTPGKYRETYAAM